jgi:hypothetical protein
MPDVASGVDTELAVEPTPEVLETATREVEAARKGLLRHALDATQHGGQPRDVLGLRGCQGEAAVPGQHRRNP